ncbi:uncharacterized mitochondrial protein-like protein [Tanacetum coccineum]
MLLLLVTTVSVKLLLSVEVKTVQIKNGNKVLKKTVGNVEQVYEPTTAEEKLERKNEMKARETLLMALPIKIRMKFHSYQDAKLLMEAIEKSSEKLDQTFDRLQKLISQLEIQGEVIEQEDMNLKLLRSLPSEWKTHALIWRNKVEIKTISLDDLYNNLKIYEPEITGSSSTTQNPQNVAFVSSNSTNNTNITNKADNTAYGDYNLCIPCKPNSPQLAQEDLEQLHLDTWEANRSTLEFLPTQILRLNNASAPIIEDWNSDDESEVEPNDKGNPQQKEYKEKGVINSSCSRHMIGNKCYLTEYEDYDGGFVSFGDGKGRKGSLRTTSGPKSMKEFSTEFEKLMHDKFQMSFMGELFFFLGLQVQQKSDGIFISQDKYVAEILKKFDFSNVKTASTPIEPNKPLIKDEEAEEVDVHVYRSMIGSLMYLTASRPNIMFVVCACARFQVTPKTSHLHAVKRIFRYLKGQPKLGLWYPRDSPFKLEAFSE